MANTIRNLIDGVYDMQKLRIATGNRVVAALRPEFLNESDKDEDKDKEQKKKDSVLKQVIKEYDRITDVYVQAYKGQGKMDKAIKDTPDRMFIKDKVDYALVQSYTQLLDAEQQLTKVVETNVKAHPMWEAFFAGVAGCGPMMAAVCLAYLDPHKARHASSFWRYCGLDVVQTEDGVMRGNGLWHTEMRPYINKKGEEAEKKSLTYNPFVKAKIVGVLAGSMLKAHGASVSAATKKGLPAPVPTGYVKAYYDYRARRAQMGDSDILQHRRAARYCAKMFLRDMWVAWRTIEGLQVSEPYEVAKLGHRPHGT